MSVTSITIGITRNMGNYESLKVEITSSIGEGSDYESAKDDIINKIMDAEASSSVLFSGTKGATKPSFAPKATPVTPATTTPTAEATKGATKPSFAPKATPATPVTPATTTPTAEVPKGLPKNPFAKKEATKEIPPLPTQITGLHEEAPF